MLVILGHQSYMTLPPLPLSQDVSPEALLRATLEVALARTTEPLVLAVSGGRDSMALLHAMARWAPTRIAAVATFDHGTGQYATDAASFVAAEARRLGLSVVRERSRDVATGEAAWRRARWRFLDRVARAFRARVATAHTRDDQLETVCIRLLRGTGTRGLAAMAAPSPVVRPWLGVTRTEVAHWAQAESIAFLEDPMNASPRFLRGRIRYDLLPALEQTCPGFGEGMLAVAEQAATWRCEVERFVDQHQVVLSAGGGRLSVAARVLEDTTSEGRAVLWPALCGRVGISLDARGTHTLERFTTEGRRGAIIPLSGGGVVLRRSARPEEGKGDRFEIRRSLPALPSSRMVPWLGATDSLPVRFARFLFRRVSEAPEGSHEGTHDLWMVGVPRGAAATLRSWTAGDRIRTGTPPASRRVARYFSEAHVLRWIDRPGR